MKTIMFTTEVTAGVAKFVFLPAPCRGTVAGVKAVYNQILDADEVFSILSGSGVVCTMTPTDALTAGTVIDGVLDAAGGSFIFDPDATTIQDRALTLNVLSTVDTSGTLALTIEFDDSAYVKQTALEA